MLKPKKQHSIIVKILSYYFKDIDSLDKIIYDIKSIEYHTKPNYNDFKNYIYNNLNLKIN